MGLNLQIHQIVKGAMLKGWRWLETEYQAQVIEEQAQRLEAEESARRRGIPYGVKPRIAKDGLSYCCMGLGAAGWGPTPKRSYEAWANYFRGMQNVRPLEFENLQKPLPTPTLDRHNMDSNKAGQTAPAQQQAASFEGKPPSKFPKTACGLGRVVR